MKELGLLDLGWLRRGASWEFHPWGPFSRGYVVPEPQERKVRKAVRLVRALVVGILCLALLLYALGFSWLVLLAVLALGQGAEGMLTWRALRGLERTPQALGWEAGFLYLAQFLGPRLLLWANALAVLLLGFSLYVLWLQPKLLEAYLLLGLLVAALFFLGYLQQVALRKRGQGPE